MSLKDQLQALFPDITPTEENIEENNKNIELKLQKEPLLCKYEKKGRNGKPVTIIEGFLGNEAELKFLAKKIKTQLGIGGSEKDKSIIIQGNNREKIIDFLENLGYKTKKIGG